MIELRTLGATALRAPDGTELRAILAQPRRLALLAYLAVALPRGFHRRDTLLALFWPDADERGGRRALSQSIYVLRQALGRDAILSRGDDEVAVDASRVRVDVAAFEEALAAGRPEDALATYGGDLLAGFHVDGAPGWERWLEAERGRLRDEAARAAWARSEAAEGEGDAAAAVRWARRAAALSPCDEGDFRRLLGVLDRAGDRAGAMQAYDDFARRLDTELETEPSGATRAVLHAIRLRHDAPAAVPVTATPPAPPARPASPDPSASSETFASPDTLVSPSRSTSPTSPASVVSPAFAETAVSVTSPGDERGDEDAREIVAGAGTRRRWLGRVARSPRVRTAGLVTLLLAVSLVGTRAAYEARPREVGAQEHERVAVMPFNVRGSDSLAYLREGMVDLLSTRLDGAGDLRAVDPHAVLGYLRAPGRAGDEFAAGEDVAARFGAGQYVLGSVVEAGGRFHVSAYLYDRGGRLRTRADGVAADEGKLFDVVDEVTRKLVAGRGRAGAGAAKTAALPTPSLPALKAYLDGEARYREGDHTGAMEAFRGALRDDPGFGLAHYRLSTAAGAAGDAGAAARAADLAARHRDGLTELDRKRVDARWAAWSGGVAQAERLYRSLQAAHPRDVESAWEMAALRWETAPSRGRPLGEADAPLRHVLALQPGHPEATLRLARLAAFQGRAPVADSLTRALLRAAPAPAARLELLALRAAVLGDAAAADSALALAPRVDAAAVQAAAERAARFGGDAALAERLARTLVRPGADRLRQRAGRESLAGLAAAGGRWAEAQAHLGRLGALDPVRAAHLRASLAALPHLRVPADELRKAADALASSAGVRGASAADAAYVPAARAYLRGLLALRLGDTRAAEEAARDLAGARGEGDAARTARALGAALRAETLAARGQDAEALAPLETAPGPRKSAAPTWAAGPAGARTRLLRGELLRRQGRHREALAWLASVEEDAGASLALRAPAALARAQALRASAKPGAGAEAARFLRLWSAADPAYAADLDAARRLATADAKVR